MHREKDIKKKYELHKKWLNVKQNIKHITTEKKWLQYFRKGTRINYWL